METPALVIGQTASWWAAWAGVAALFLILWERLSQRFNWWMLCRTLPYVATEFQRGYLNPIQGLKQYWLWFLTLLWPREQRVFANELVARFCGFEESVTPLPFDPEPAFMEARLYAKKRHEKRQRRPVIRAHRYGYFHQRIKCSDNCGTRYGKPHPGFWTTQPMHGWTCKARKCSLLEPHYCGSCAAHRDALSSGVHAQG